MNLFKEVQMKYLRYISILFTIIIAASCSIENFELPEVNKDDQFKIVGRVARFDDCYVDTRANKTPDEAYVSSMALAVFPIEDEAVADCISYIHLVGNNLTFTIDRNDIPEQYDNEPFALYIFANMPDLPHDFASLTDRSLGFFMSKVNANNGIRRPQTGFPMIGSLGDTVSERGDGTTFILKPVNDDGKTLLPTLNGEHKDYIPIPMEALYSKFSFEISVVPDQYMEDGVAPMFTITEYSINNIPAEVYGDNNLNINDINTIKSSVLTSPVTAPLSAYASGGTTINFDFYLPERLVVPETSASEYEYPLGENSSPIEGYENVRPEDQKYCQRFKHELLGNNQAATYITITGQFRDHQNHYSDVTYKIYLGGDNYSNFDILRNTHYFNTVVIKGLTASSDQSVNPDGVAIDHRVSVKRSLPVVVNLRRETHLDSHFEVRPLRVHYPLAESEILPDGAKVKVEVRDAEDPENINKIPTWLRIEHNNGDGEGDDAYCASGKRRYFTTGLVSETLKNDGESNGHKVGKCIEVELNGGQQETFWIYVDQCDDKAPEKEPNKNRKAIIRVTYTDVNGEQEPLDYVLSQYMLYPVVTYRNGEGEDGSKYIYYIEHEEEYLHNYDSEDSFGMTENAGMEWGLNGIQLSNEFEAFLVSHVTGEGNNIFDQIGDYKSRADQAFKTLSPRPYYDFYLKRDIIKILGEYYDSSLLNDGKYGGVMKLQDFNGYALNTHIRDYLKLKYPTDERAKIDGIALDEQPKSAYAYCYNRNKRQPDGTVNDADRVWYLPSIDEIEDIAEFAYGDFDTQFQGNPYWSCQPAYQYTTVALQRYRYILFWWEEVSGNVFYGSYFSDDTSHARATQALREGGVFQGVPSSGAEPSQHRDGKIYISATNSKNTEFGDPQIIEDDPYSGHPMNLAREGDMARVRCVRKMN